MSLRKVATKSLDFIHHFGTCPANESGRMCTCGADKAIEAIEAALNEPDDGWHPSVIAIANAMQEKLVKNANKDGWGDNNKGKRGWMPPDCTIEFLIRKLNEETKELRYAARRDNLHMTDRLNDIRLEAADVANIAMMIADNLGALPSAPKEKS